MKLALSKLNGWQRLFTGLILFIYLPFAIIMVSDAGAYLRPLENKSLFKMVSSDLLLSLHSGDSVLKNKNDSIDWDLAAGKKFVRFTVGEEGTNLEYDLYISANVEPKKATELADGFTKVIQSYVFKLKLTEKSLMALYFLLGALFIYAFGWTLGWIYKGFKKPL